MTRRSKIFLLTIFCVAAIAAFLFIQIGRAGQGNLEVWFLDVGQGDSILIRTPENKDILIDGGPSRVVLEELGEVLPFWDRNIDLVVLTHPHADHINGLVEVLQRYQVVKVLTADVACQSDSCLAFSNLIKEKNIEKNIAQEDQRIVLGKDINLDVLYSPENLEEKIEDFNDTSLILKLSYGDVDFLLEGDAPSKNEKKILNKNIDSEFLKVGHHGSRYSSDPEFLKAVTPLVSFISVGKGNSYGHPHKETLTRLADVGSKILRTDIAGRIEVEVEGDGRWRVKCEKTCN